MGSGRSARPRLFAGAVGLLVLALNTIAGVPSATAQVVGTVLAGGALASLLFDRARPGGRAPLR